MKMKLNIYLNHGTFENEQPAEAYLYLLALPPEMNIDSETDPCSQLADRLSEGCIVNSWSVLAVIVTGCGFLLYFFKLAMKVDTGGDFYVMYVSILYRQLHNPSSVNHNKHQKYSN